MSSPSFLVKWMHREPVITWSLILGAGGTSYFGLCPERGLPSLSFSPIHAVSVPPGTPFALSADPSIIE